MADAYKWNKAMPKPAKKAAGYQATRGEVDKRIASLKEENALLTKQIDGLKSSLETTVKLADTVEKLEKKLSAIEAEKESEKKSKNKK